jgi:hypothetical protein
MRVELNRDGSVRVVTREYILHTWEGTVGKYAAMAQQRCFPHAFGMNRTRRPRCYLLTSVPRVRGDDPT